MTYQNGIYQMENPEAVGLLERLATSLGFMNDDLLAYIREQRERLRPRTPQELRREFDGLRRKRHTENEMMRGVDERDADRVEELRTLLLSAYPSVMSDYIKEYGSLRFCGDRSDVWCYYDQNGGCAYYEIWNEYIEQGTLVRCELLPAGEVVTLRDGFSYEVPA